MAYTIPSDTSDEALVAAIRRLIQHERQATVHVIAHLAEVERRHIHLAAGFPSMFAYCTAALGLSEHEAFHRILAARTAVQFPVVLDLLDAGRVNLTTVKLVAPHLTAENHRDLLDEVAGRTRREVEVRLAARFPQPDVPTSVRKVATARGTALAVPATLDLRSPTTARVLALSASAPLSSTAAGAPGQAPSVPSVSATPGTASSPSMPPATRPAVVRPLAADRYHVSFTATADTIEKLRAAQDLVGHAVPSGDVAQVIDRALTLLVADLTRRKAAVTDRSRTSRTKTVGDRHIPADVKRAAWKRDGGRCTFVGKHGHRCDARRRLEFHHVLPYAAGGKATVENIRLACRVHNAYEADRFFAASREGREPTRPGPSWPQRATRAVPAMTST